MSFAGIVDSIEASHPDVKGGVIMYRRGVGERPGVVSM